jgi:transcriptional regulator with XRE-family HTH domain
MATSTVGTTLRVLRQQRGWTRETLAHTSGVSLAAIAQIESGRRTDVRLSSLTALADALEVGLETLARGTAATRKLQHRVFLYRDDDEFLSVAVPFLRRGLDAGERPLAVTSARNVELLRDAAGRKARAGVRFVDSAAWYRTPRNALSGYRDYVDTALAEGAAAVTILGEPVWDQRSEAEIRAWTRYESLLNLVFESKPATVMCPYHLSSLPRSVIAGASRTHPELHAVHGSVSNESYVAPEDLLVSA